MKFIKSNILSIVLMTVLFSAVMMGDAAAAPGGTVFGVAAGKLLDLFKNAKMVLFIIGGFGLIALAFQAIFGKVKWAWFAALAFGLAVVAAASKIIDYAATDSNTTGQAVNIDNNTLGDMSDTLGGKI